MRIFWTIDNTTDPTRVWLSESSQAGSSWFRSSSQSGRSHKCFLFLKLEHEVAISRVNSFSKDVQEERQQQLSLHSCFYKRKIFLKVRATSFAFVRAWQISARRGDKSVIQSVNLALVSVWFVSFVRQRSILPDCENIQTSIFQALT